MIMHDADVYPSEDGIAREDHPAQETAAATALRALPGLCSGSLGA